MEEEKLKVLVDGEWHEASPGFQETVRRIDEGLKRKLVSMPHRPIKGTDGH